MWIFLYLQCLMYSLTQNMNNFVITESFSGQPYDGMLPAPPNFPSYTFLDNTYISKVNSIWTFATCWLLLLFVCMESYKVFSFVCDLFLV